MTLPDSGEREVHRKHRHGSRARLRCMRCGGEFECHAESCAAGYDVLPRQVERGLDGQVRVVEHDCEPPKESGWKEIAHGVYEKPTDSECAPDYDPESDPPPEVGMSLSLAQRILAALEDMGDMAMAKELRARIPR